MTVVIVDSFTIEPECWVPDAVALAKGTELRLVVEKREGTTIPYRVLEDYNKIEATKIFEAIGKKTLSGQDLRTLVRRIWEAKSDPEFVLVTMNLECVGVVPELRAEGIDIMFTSDLKCVLVGKYLFRSLEQVRLAKELGFERYDEVEYALAKAQSFKDFKARTRAVLSEVEWIRLLSTVGRYKNSLWR